MQLTTVHGSPSQWIQYQSLTNTTMGYPFSETVPGKIPNSSGAWGPVGYRRSSMDDVGIITHALGKWKTWIWSDADTNSDKDTNRNGFDSVFGLC